MKRRLSACILAAAALLLSAVPAAALFEYSTLYGMGAASYSLGPMGIPSLDDPMGFLLNPGLFGGEKNRTIVLTLGGMSEKESDGKFQMTGFTYITPKRNAISLISYTEPLISRHNELIYTASRGGEGGRYGANIRLFDFTEQNGENSSSLSVDIGYHGGGRARWWYDLVLKNIISPNLAVSKSLDPELAKTIVLGAGWQWDDNTRIYLSTQKRLASKSEPARQVDFQKWSLGLEYSMPNRYSGRVGGSSLKTNTTDETASGMAFGGSFRTPSMSFDAGWTTSNEFFSSGSYLTMAYAKVKTEPPAAASTKPAKKPTEKPLAAVDDEETPADKPEKPDEHGEDAYGTFDKPGVTTVAPGAPKELEDFVVKPEAILSAAAARSDFDDMKGHWAEKPAAELARSGFLIIDDDNFMPNTPVSREEFYRLLFVTQLEDLFSRPVDAAFDAPAEGTLTVELQGPSMSKAVKLLSRELKEAGRTSISLPPELFEEKGIAPGRYKLICTLDGGGGKTWRAESGVTVLDTAMDFSRFAAMAGDQKKQAVDEVKSRLAPLGMPLDYLDNLKLSGDITRIEALAASLDALGADWALLPVEDVFSDTWGLEKQEKKAVYLASRGLDGLRGRALMTGFGDGLFRPQKVITRGEAAAFVSRLRKVAAADLKPPYKPETVPDALATTPPIQIPGTDGAPLIAGTSGIVKPPKQQPRGAKPYRLVALTTPLRERAVEFADILTSEGRTPVIIEENLNKEKLWHVLFGMYSTIVEAEAQRRSLETAGYEVYLSGAQDASPTPLPSSDKTRAKRPADSNTVIEVKMKTDVPPPVADNLSATLFAAPESKSEKYQLIVK